MKKVAILTILIQCVLFTQIKDYNLNKTFRVIKKYENISSSDNIDFTFFIDTKYKFTDSGKKTYIQNVDKIKKEINKLKSVNTKNDREKKENEININVYEGMLKSITPPENFVSFILNIALYDNISKYVSSYIENIIEKDSKTFYKNLKNEIMKTSNDIGYFTSIDFITEKRYEKIIKD